MCTMERYDFASIEKKWQETWFKDGVYEPDFEKPRGKGKFYNLMMFPYPSAEGLHVGNMYAFTGADIYGRMKRMQGYDVFEPIGLDGFGIHSENYAMKIGAHPMEQSKVSQENFYRQLQMIGNGFAWKEKLETYDPAYYRWTQWLFVQMWRHGLAYRKKQSVNWCPSCKTVLADEQVIAGKCERCSTEVVKKALEQWFFRITKYAGKLLENIETIDWSERVKVAQRNWIGRSEGAEIAFPVTGTDERIVVFTTRPDTLFGATYMVLSPENELVEKLRSQISNFKEVEAYRKEAAAKSETERTAEEKEKTGVELKGVKAVNPVNKEEIPIFIADYVLAGYGTGAIMAVPAHDERDFAFAKEFNLPIPVVISNGMVREPLTEAYVGDGALVNSEKFDGMSVAEAVPAVTEFAGGKLVTQYRLRDWLISRQRYWGAPIPMVHCDVCEKAGKGEQAEMPGWYAVPEDQLPVTLPFVKDFRPKGKDESPLASVREFYETACPGCGGKAKRETDVSDTFLDSAWYYLRYPSVNSKTKNETPWDPNITKTWLPVNLYTGGAEHSVLHLLYVRFVAMALHEWGMLHFEEPFPRFRAHGLLIKEGAKMSKSKGNVVNPDEYIKKFGADALRMYLMFLAPFEQGGDFRDAGILGIERFLRNVWLYVSEWKEDYENARKNDSEFFKRYENETFDDELQKKIHQTIKKVLGDIEELKYNTAISALMIFLNEIRSEEETGHKGLSAISKRAITKKQLFSFLKLLAPFAPHIAEELWHELGNNDSIHRSAWPTYDEAVLVESTAEIAVQVNGRLRGTVTVPASASQADVEAAARADGNVAKFVAGTVRKVIYVPGRLINFVV
jgi:leucyl-tRNA synthetase